MSPNISIYESCLGYVSVLSAPSLNATSLNQRAINAPYTGVDSDDTA